jgi:hypothetical protein
MSALFWDQSPPILKRMGIAYMELSLEGMFFRIAILPFPWVCLLMSVVYDNLETR